LPIVTSIVVPLTGLSPAMEGRGAGFTCVFPVSAYHFCCSLSTKI